MKKCFQSSPSKCQKIVGFITLATTLAACSSIQARREAQEQASTPSNAASENTATKQGDSAPTKPSEAPAQQAAQTTTHPNDKRTEASAEYHFSLAQAYVAEGNPDRAIEEYKITLMFDPKSALVYTRLAAEYIKKGMLTSAMEACKEALQRDPKFIDARLMLAGLFSASRENSAALEEYDRVLKQDPKHEEAIVYKSQILVEEGKGEEANKSLRSFLKKNSESVLAWYYLGRAEQQMDHFKEAASAYRKALDLRPGFTQGALALGYLYESKSLNDQAVKIYQELFEASQDMTAANRLATILLKQEKFKQALPYLEAAAAADPEDLNARVKMGLIEMELKDYDKAVAVFKGILATNPDSDRIHYYLGSLYEEIKQFDTAMGELRQIKPDSKLYSEAALHVAYLLKQTGKIDDAKSFIKEAIGKSPRISGFYVFQASLEEEGKNLPAAIKVLKRAAEQFPEDEKILYYLGSLYDRTGDSDKGLEQMETILKVNPQNVDALNYIGYTWTQKGVRLNDAEKLLRKAVGLKPDNGYIQDSWGYYLFVRGRMPEAVVELEKAVKLKPNEPTILEHLGDAYLSSNLREKAMRQYQDAARYAEDETFKKKLEGKIQTVRTELATGGHDKTTPDVAPSRMPASSTETK